MKKIPNIFLAILSALLLSAGWYAPTTILLFVAWVPLLIITERIAQTTAKKLPIIGWSFLVFLIWNITVTWWVSYASFGGAVFAFIGNSVFMCITFMVWYNLKKRIKKDWSVWLLIPIWLAYEYGHSVWDFSWSWLIIGNAFAFNHNWVQWYEFTGVSGGSLWVLIVNVILFQLIKQQPFSIKTMIKPVALIMIPIVFSFIILAFRESQYKAITRLPIGYNTLVVQPNVDPYNDKFNIEPAIQLQNLMLQIKGSLNDSVDFLVLPETYLTENITEGQEAQSLSLRILRDSILNKYPKLTIITGASSLYQYGPNETPSATARKFSDANLYYDYYNTGVQFNKEGISYYHKSKLVPGAEVMPMAWLLKPLESFALDLGGTMGSLGTQKNRGVFFSHDKQIGIAPVICYESAYADYVTEYIRHGANLIFIITNDGWWDNTPGHRQHLAYAQLRAIENRREIARSANTGISCFITATGDVEQATKYWEPALISKNMTPHNELTFFSRFGDLISYTASTIAILLVAWSQFLRFKNRTK